MAYSRRRWRDIQGDRFFIKTASTHGFVQMGNTKLLRHQSHSIRSIACRTAWEAFGRRILHRRHVAIRRRQRTWRGTSAPTASSYGCRGSLRQRRVTCSTRRPARSAEDPPPEPHGSPSGRKPWTLPAGHTWKIWYNWDGRAIMSNPVHVCWKPACSAAGILPDRSASARFIRSLFGTATVNVRPIAVLPSR